MEPFTLTSLLIGSAFFGSNVAGAAIGGILGNRADDFCCRAYQRIYQWLQDRRNRPVNHDLQKAVLRAYLHAQRIVAEECVRQSEPRWKLVVRHSDEVKWLLDKIADLKGQLAQVDKCEYVEPPLQALDEIELLVFQPNGNGVRDHADALRQQLVDELLTEKGVPEPYRQRLTADFFPLMSALFCHELKHNEAVRAIFESEMLAHLDLRLAEQQAQQSVSVNKLMADMQASLQATAELTELSKEWFERLDGQLTTLRQEMGAGFAQMGVRFDEVIQRIVEGEFPRLLEEVRSLRQEVERLRETLTPPLLRESKRLEGNAFLLGWDLFAVISPDCKNPRATAEDIRARLRTLSVKVDYPDPVTQRQDYLNTLHFTLQSILSQIRAGYGDNLAGYFLLAVNTLITCGKPSDPLSFSGILHALGLVFVLDNLRKDLDELMRQYEDGKIADSDRGPILQWSNKIHDYFVHHGEGYDSPKGDSR